MFQSFESCIFQFSPPENRALLQQISQRPADNAKVTDKLAIVACQPEETLYFLELLGVSHDWNAWIFFGSVHTPSPLIS
jgi:hypothetical protein